MSLNEPSDDKQSRFLLTHEAAKYLRVNPRTMANWRAKGTGPKFRKHGGIVVYSRSELERYSSDADKTHVG